MWQQYSSIFQLLKTTWISNWVFPPIITWVLIKVLPVLKFVICIFLAVCDLINRHLVPLKSNTCQEIWVTLALDSHGYVSNELGWFLLIFTWNTPSCKTIYFSQNPGDQIIVLLWKLSGDQTPHSWVKRTTAWLQLFFKFLDLRFAPSSFLAGRTEDA